MLKGKQTVMKRRLHRKHMWVQKQNKQKLGFLGNNVTQLEQVCVRRLDHAYANPT